MSLVSKSQEPDQNYNRLSQDLDELDNKINLLDKVSGFKKSIQEHNKLRKELDDLDSKITEYERTIINININSNSECSLKGKPDSDTNLIITDDDYNKHIEEIKLLSESDYFETQIKEPEPELYKRLVYLINVCDKYLAERKLELVYV
jgi:hypothetical protein